METCTGKPPHEKGRRPARQRLSLNHKLFDFDATFPTEVLAEAQEFGQRILADLNSWERARPVEHGYLSKAAANAMFAALTTKPNPLTSVPPILREHFFREEDLSHG